MDPTSVRRWLHDRPRVADGILGLALFGLSVMIRPDGAHPPSLAPPAAIALMALAGGCLTVRRERPVAVWAVTVLLGVGGILVIGGNSPVVLPGFVALYTLATRAGRRAAASCAAVTASTLLVALSPFLTRSWQDPVIFAVIAWSGLAAATGVAVGGQRAVVAAARDRALRAELTREEEAQRRVAQERLHIARELHDVIAHHIAVINVQAGVAGHLIDLQPEQARTALAQVRRSSRLVLSEMATILGLLRTSDETGERQPMPRLEQIDDLVEDARRAGLVVVCRVSGTPVSLPPILDLTAHRLVQESLTNARKHGAGPVDVTVRYLEDMVLIEVTNPRSRPNPAPPGDGWPEPGHGLVGMRERVVAVGGRLEVGTQPDGSFRVHAELPLQREQSLEHG